MHNVVLRITEGLQKGIKVWVSYDNKEKFLKAWETMKNNLKVEVVAEGVTVETAISYVMDAETIISGAAMPLRFATENLEKQIENFKYSKLPNPSLRGDDK